MITRRTLITRGGLAAVAMTGAPFFLRDAFGQSVATFDYYIGPNGSDSNPGTQSQPWAITALNTKQSVYAGKKVGLLDGTYNVYSLCQAGSYSSPALRVNGGTAGSPTVVAAVNARQAILTAANPSGGGYPTNQCAIIGQGSGGQPTAGNVVVDGLYLTRSMQFGATFYPSAGSSAPGGATGTVIQNCEIYDIAGNENGNMGGVLFYYNTGAVVRNCKIHACIPTSGNVSLWDCAGIFSQECLGNVYEYNTVYDCNVAIYDKNTTAGSTYRYNYLEVMGTYSNSAFEDCAGGGAGTAVTAYNNIIVSPTGIWGSNAAHLPSLQKWVLYNNTFWYPNGAFAGQGSAGVFLPTSATVTFYNNIVACAASGATNGPACFCDGTVALSDYNCFQGAKSDGGVFAISPASSPYAFKDYSIPAWQTYSGKDSHSQLVAIGTLFRSATLGNPASFKTLPAGVAGAARVGGVSSGASTDPGAWGNGAAQIGCNFGPRPLSPALSVT